MLKNKIQELFQWALQQRTSLGIDQLALVGLLRTQKGISLFEGAIDAVELADEIKIGVLAARQGRWGSASLEQADQKALKQALEQAALTAQFSDPDPDLTLAPPSSTSPAISPDHSILTLGLDQLKNWGLQLESQAKAFSPKICNVPGVQCSFTAITRLLANSEGNLGMEETIRLSADLSVMAVGADKRVVNAGQSLTTLHKKDFSLDQLVREVAEEAVGRTEPRPPAQGDWPILFDKHTAGHLLSTFSTIFSGDLLYRGLAKLAGKRGQTVASPIVSILDQGNAGLTPHQKDAEGTPCHPKQLIAAGLLENFLHNRYTARKTGTESTGNATGGIGAPFGVTPSNISWEGTLTPAQELLSSIKQGIFINEINGASASPITGDFSYGALGYWIENGRIAYPVADFTIAGNFFDLLKQIEGIGNDLHYASPHLLGSTGGRSLLIRALSVSARQ